MSEASLSVLDGRDVLVWADADDPGREHAQETAERLVTLGPERTVKIFEYGSDGDDAFEYFAQAY